MDAPRASVLVHWSTGQDRAALVHEHLHACATCHNVVWDCLQHHRCM